MGSYKKGNETKEKLLIKAEKLFYEKGYNDTLISEIVEEFNNKAYFTYHFKTKENIARIIYYKFLDSMRILQKKHNLLTIRNSEEALQNNVIVAMIYLFSLNSNPNISRFYREISTLPFYLEDRNNIMYEYFAQCFDINDSSITQLKNDLDFVSSAEVAMESIVIKEFCNGKFYFSYEEMVDKFLYYSRIMNPIYITYLDKFNKTTDTIKEYIKVGHEFVNKFNIIVTNEFEIYLHEKNINT